MHSVDYRSYIKYECDKAMEADIDIVVLYNNTRVDRSKCPEAVRYHGNHVAMMYYRDGKYYWDYPAVKKSASVKTSHAQCRSRHGHTCPLSDEAILFQLQLL